MKQGCDSLNDIAILEAYIPECGELMKHSDTELEALVVVQIGPEKPNLLRQMTLDTKMHQIRSILLGQAMEALLALPNATLILK